MNGPTCARAFFSCIFPYALIATFYVFNKQIKLINALIKLASKYIV